MEIDNKANKVKEIISSGENIAILPSKVAAADGFAAGAGLYHMLKASGRNVSFIYPGKVPEACEGLLGAAEIVTDIASRELIVSVDYSETPAAKVQYSTENSVLFLRISPVNKNFDHTRIKSHLSGTSYDVMITIGAQALEDFGQTFRELEPVFYSAKLLNLDNTDRNFRFGNVNVVDPFDESLSMLVLNKSRFWSLKLTSAAAKALLTGITYRDKNIK